MSTLPPLPDSPFEGGAPQSRVAPGDTGRELLHEVKNLAQSVTLLHSVVRKTRTRQAQFVWSMVAAVLALLLAVGYTRLATVESTKERLAAAYDACDADNQRSEIEINMLEAVVLQSKSPEAEAFFRPRIDAFRALTKDCSMLYPYRSDMEGHPAFWDFPF